MILAVILVTMIFNKKRKNLIYLTIFIPTLKKSTKIKKSKKAK